jgi:alanine racemase
VVSTTISEIVRATSARILDTFPDESRVSRILFDSRKLTTVPGTLFVAIKGQHRDGHDFVLDLFQKGVRNFLLSKPLHLPGRANVLLVEDGLAAIQALAADHRDNFGGKVIGVTGSNGKTVVKEWIFQGLHNTSAVTRSPRSYNSQLGVPLSLLEIESYHQVAVLEAGISFPGEMDRLETMIRPTIGVLTTLGPAHDEHFSSRDEKLREKLKLFRNAEVLVYPSDNQLIAEEVSNRIPPQVRRWSWGKQGTAFQVMDIEKQGRGTKVRIMVSGREYPMVIPFRDDASIDNALTLCAVLLYFGFTTNAIQDVFDGLHPIEMRLELKEGVNGCTLINDSYSSDLMSLEVALDFLAQQDDGRERLVILSDILQSGMPGAKLYAEVARQLRIRNIDKVIGIGTEIQLLATEYGGTMEFFPSVEDFLNTLGTAGIRNKVILLKGARSFRFERIVARLQKKAHETVLRINLNALVHNLKYFQSKLEPGTKVMAMVKAFGYGSGTHEIASVLQFHKVDYLAVAYADEGYELRMAGIKMPIMVMNPDSDSLIPSLSHQLEPEIYGFRLLDELIAGLDRHTDLSLPVGIHIKIDTGMHRLGFLPAEIPALLQKIKDEQRIRVLSVFTHLASSEDVREDDFTLQQISLFSKASEMAASVLGYPFLRHVMNSAGIARFKDAHFEMVRLGLGLYGVSSNAEDQAYLENVGTLRSVISQIKFIPAGDTVGYNRAWTASRPSRIGVVPIGYADGLDMRLGNGDGRLQVNGHLVPIVGKICMDMCMVDLTDIEAEEGDEVTVFGDKIGVAELASKAGTIPYEFLTGISSRVKRVYYYD